MAVTALRIHRDRLAQAPPDLPQEAAEHIQSLLTLQLPQANVKVNDLVESGGPATQGSDGPLPLAHSCLSVNFPHESGS